MTPRPNFERIAARILRTLGVSLTGDAYRQAAGALVQDLRQVWNARGAADVEKVNAGVGWMQGTLTSADGAVPALVQAIRSLDR